MMKHEHVALITGGSRRVGAAIVRRLAKAGYWVVFTYNHSAPEADALVAALGAEGRHALALHADFNDPAGGARLAERLLAEVGRCDVLVNNAALYKPDVDCPAPLAEHMRVNVEAPLALIDRLAVSLGRNEGRVINMVDLLAERPMRAYGGYCASKAALVNVTLAKARELAPRVTVNGIAPGVVEWPDDFPLDAREAYLAKVPLARPGTPEDVAALVHFLVTEGTYITGQIIRLDGGRSLL